MFDQYLKDLQTTLNLKHPITIEYINEVRCYVKMNDECPNTIYVYENIKYLEKVLKISIYEALAHEALHLSQLESGRLEVLPCGEFIMFNGKKYSLDMPYESQPWEIEADKKQAQVMNNALYLKKVA